MPEVTEKRRKKGAKTGLKQGFKELFVLSPCLSSLSQPADFVEAMTTKNQATVPWTTVACPSAMVVVEAVEFKNSLNVSYIIYRLIINKSSEFMKKKSIFLWSELKKVCFRHIV